MNKLTRRFVAVLMACLMILTTNGVAFAAEQIGAATADAAAASESDVIEEDAAVEDEAAENEESSEENQDDASYEESSEEEHRRKIKTMPPMRSHRKMNLQKTLPMKKRLLPMRKRCPTQVLLP